MIIYKNKIIMHVPKTAGTSVIEAAMKDWENLDFKINHFPIKGLESALFEYAKDYEKIALVREPVSWYKSFYNYVKGTPEYITHDALNRVLMFNEKGEILSIDEYIENCLNFSSIMNKNIDNIMRNTLKAKGGWMKWMFPSQEVEFTHNTFYQFMIDSFIDETVKTFKMETEMYDFLKYVGIKKIYKHNKSLHNIEPSEESIRKIKEKDSILYERLGYDIN